MHSCCHSFFLSFFLSLLFFFFFFFFLQVTPPAPENDAHQAQDQPPVNHRHAILLAARGPDLQQQQQQQQQTPPDENVHSPFYRTTGWPTAVRQFDKEAILALFAKKSKPEKRMWKLVRTYVDETSRMVQAQQYQKYTSPHSFVKLVTCC